jgi:hypothetical protein
MRCIIKAYYAGNYLLPASSPTVEKFIVLVILFFLLPFSTRRLQNGLIKCRFIGCANNLGFTKTARWK